MTNIERKAEEYAKITVELFDEAPSLGAVEGLIESAFLDGSKEGQREAFEAMTTIMKLATPPDRPSMATKLDQIYDIAADYLSRKEKE
jgi:hypothetical protein